VFSSLSVLFFSAHHGEIVLSIDIDYHSSLYGIQTIPYAFRSTFSSVMQRLGGVLYGVSYSD